MGERSAASPLSVLDPHRIAFRGWSGSAQMVSWLMNLAAKKRLPGLTIGAGIMMAGGSHACYNWPGHGAVNNCQHCNATQGEAAFTIAMAFIDFLAIVIRSSGDCRFWLT